MISIFKSIKTSISLTVILISVITLGSTIITIQVFAKSEVSSQQSFWTDETVCQLVDLSTV